MRRVRGGVHAFRSCLSPMATVGLMVNPPPVSSGG